MKKRSHEWVKYETIKNQFAWAELHETKQYSYSSRKKFYYCGKRCNEAFELFQLMSNLSGFCHDWLHLRVLAMICKNVQRLWLVSYTHFVFSFPFLFIFILFHNHFMIISKYFDTVHWVHRGRRLWQNKISIWLFFRLRA